MPDVKNALVFPCGSEIGLELRRALGSSRHFRLVGATSTADHGAYAYADLENLPRVDAAGFLPAFEALLSRREIDFVLPAHDEVLIRLAEWAAAGGSGAEIIAPPVEVCRLCRSKNATYAFFADKLPTPRRFSPADLDRAPYPLFMKPDAGQGGRGAALVGDAAAAREKLRQSPADLILEYLPGREYTIDCFTDRRRRLLYAAGRIRNRVANGISVDSRDCPDPRFQPLAESINQAIQLRGAWFFQLREDAAGTLRLLEIAPRIAGTSGLRRVMGVNLPLLSLYDRLGLEVELIDNRLAGTAVDRALASVYRAPLDFATVYMDLDDTLTAGDGVNPDAVKFLFQCRNRGRRLILLTRHAVSPRSTLRRLRLESLFDETIWLRKGEDKSSRICEKNAVFIDDSFSERQEVSQRTGIPVFDVSAIEGLLEP